LIVCDVSASEKGEQQVGRESEKREAERESVSEKVGEEV
jgi:hypothetical protein